MQYGELSPPSSCPYCAGELKREPKRKTKCIHCGRSIYVRSNQPLYPTGLVTEEQAREVDEWWSREHWYRSELSRQREYGIDSADIDTIRAELRTRFGAEPGTEDVLWAMYSETLRRNPLLHRSIHYSRALFLNFEGRDHVQLLQEVHRLRLEELRFGGVIERVRISATWDSCPACQQQADTIGSVFEALRTMPLPCLGCTREMYAPDVGFCRCQYVAEI